jgi:hypothetical protein
MQKAIAGRLGVWMAVFILAAGCGDDQDPVDALGLDFFPVTEASFLVYSVEETVYSNSQPTSSSFEWRWEIRPTESTPSSRLFTIRTFTRTLATDPWVESTLISGEQDGQKLLVYEGNIPFVRMMYPLANGLTWDGNQFNTLGGEEKCGNSSIDCDVFEVIDLNEPLNLNDLSFDQTITVIQSNEEDVIVGNDIRKEVYARGVGLVTREVNQVVYCTAPACLGQQQIETGVVRTQKLKEYGSL